MVCPRVILYSLLVFLPRYVVDARIVRLRLRTVLRELGVRTGEILLIVRGVSCFQYCRKLVPNFLLRLVVVLEFVLDLPVEICDCVLVKLFKFAHLCLSDGALSFEDLRQVLEESLKYWLELLQRLVFKRGYQEYFLILLSFQKLCLDDAVVIYTIRNCLHSQRMRLE